VRLKGVGAVLVDSIRIPTDEEVGMHHALDSVTACGRSLPGVFVQAAATARLERYASSFRGNAVFDLTLSADWRYCVSGYSKSRLGRLERRYISLRVIEGNRAPATDQRYSQFNILFLRGLFLCSKDVNSDTYGIQ
jgi:hypothetical protein